MLFSNEPIPFNLPDADITYHPHLYDPIEADLILDALMNDIPWQQDPIKIFGQVHMQPRLTALFGDGKPYSYSNITMHPTPWNTLLLKIKKEVEVACETSFNTVLLNLYRDGRDSNGWHSDNEKELGINPAIASLSLGAERIFHLKHNSKALKQSILLGHGSLLLMKGTTQHFWKHQIPKTAKPAGPRVNLTFRTVY